MTKFAAILEAWKAQDDEVVNAAVADYRNLLTAATPEELTIDNMQVSLAKGRFEGFYERFGAFNLLSFAYVLALLLTLGGWGAAGFGSLRLGPRAPAVGALDGHRPLRPAYGGDHWPDLHLRPSASDEPVLLRHLHRLGGGRCWGWCLRGCSSRESATRWLRWPALRRSASPTRLVSDGDTLGVVEAVLDTQFWLATHVVCITLGYAATYVAGMFGLMYVLRGSRWGSSSWPRCPSSAAYSACRPAASPG